jgi:hypothetical protein
LRPVSTKAGILPAAASMTIRPVGVGLMSLGPSGVDGLTITAGRPCSATSFATSVSARVFERLYGPMQSSAVADRVSSPSRSAVAVASVATLLV